MSAPVELFLPPTAGAPSEARRELKTPCRTLPAQVREDTLLLTTELVTNAVRYGSDEVTVRVWPGPDRVRVEVSDAAPGQPRTGEPGFEEESGRGLQIVDSLASRWGTMAGPASPGKTVWFEVTPCQA